MPEIWAPTQININHAAEILRRGGLVAFPTETVYGLGANAASAEAVRSIFTAKGRPSSNPVIVHVSHVDQLIGLGTVPASGYLLAEMFWPGPLTLVIKKTSAVPDAVTAGGETVAVRMPNHPVALDLLRACGLPLAAPSANRSEQISPTTAEHVQLGLGENVDAIIDGGPCIVGLESTVLDITLWPPVILRAGMISGDDIARVLNLSGIETNQHSDALAKSPGQMTKHYAPRTKLIYSPALGSERIDMSVSTGLITTAVPTHEKTRFVKVIEMPDTPSAYARCLYAAFHGMDELALDLILIDPVPSTPQWAAIADRISRAVTKDSF